jgi:protein-L-isoaspartate(D-aspartate) O-methyltransferase
MDRKLAQQAGPARRGDTEETRQARHRMVEQQLRGRDIRDERVLQAMEAVPRHWFVEPGQLHAAYRDGALPIGHGQTISQPYIVALMTQLALPSPEARALEIGTGCGYQAAILSQLVARVFSIEIVPELAEAAAARAREMGLENLTIRVGDGSHGWPEEAPFDIILAAAAPLQVPAALLGQLAPGGRLILPVGGSSQMLLRITRQRDGTIEEEEICPVAFVPMTGNA